MKVFVCKELKKNENPPIQEDDRTQYIMNISHKKLKGKKYEIIILLNWCYLGIMQYF